MTEPEILRGWKEIEAYLHMTRKAILSSGYPLYSDRGTGSKRRNIFALRNELLAHAKRNGQFTTPPEA